LFLLSLASLLAALAILLFPAVMFAHAEPSASTPAPEETLKEAPTSVTVTFSQTVNPNGSDIIVYDTKGAKLSTGAASIVNGDLKKMSLPMQGTDSEEYLVVGHTLSADNDESAIGSFRFAMNPNSATDPTAPAGDGSSTSGSGASPLVVILVGLVGLVGLVAGGAGGYALARRRSTS
jgi:methionine-rich copper-binding protein CopC